MFDATNTVITVSRDSVLRGYYVPKEKCWRLPLINKADSKELTTRTKTAPADILKASLAPPTEYINNAYKIKSQQELVHYYHAFAGFPTKAT